ncbi:hypothetical protein GCM10011351_31620 [Paraliobacillus quinghaiensis]|uniref:Uncharacterized protein n=1 Tax=Paraliobacillus quinghaiensis TaxID=470815 RepID=A0A917TYX4_9BACI|nr:hypothetical protein [Paraliobacillus quinghaiensis]GGM43329.1 hypothetical protein GCM10011351_31620 [Paraliobacillus quinghaiensis]
MGKVIDVFISTENGYNIKKVGEKKMIDQIKKFDNNFPDGVFAVPRSSNEPRVKVRALHDYCKSRGITPADISEEEMEKFLDR